MVTSNEATRWWSAFGRDPGELTEVRTVTSGASGSAVYRLHTKDSELVLKVTTRRELSVYRDLGPRLPVVLPRLVAGIEGGDRACLLLEAAGVPSKDPERWNDLAGQLGELHHDRIATAAADWSLAKPEQPERESEVVAAIQFWTAFGYDRLPEFDKLNAALAELPPCLCHGDWHLGNLLLDASDRFVWIDWQEAGFGRGPEDLALLWQRAEFDGLAPPREAMLAAYARAREIPDDAILRRATAAAELTLLLLSWPAYLAGAPEAARARLLRRLEHLIQGWQSGSAASRPRGRRARRGS